MNTTGHRCWARWELAVSPADVVRKILLAMRLDLPWLAALLLVRQATRCLLAL